MQALPYAQIRDGCTQQQIQREGHLFEEPFAQQKEKGEYACDERRSEQLCSMVAGQRMPCDDAIGQKGHQYGRNAEVHIVIPIVKCVVPMKEDALINACLCVVGVFHGKQTRVDPVILEIKMTGQESLGDQLVLIEMILQLAVVYRRKAHRQCTAQADEHGGKHSYAFYLSISTAERDFLKKGNSPIDCTAQKDHSGDADGGYRKQWNIQEHILADVMC